jgi:hypothetical protein
MSQQVVEIIHGRHRVYHVVLQRSVFGCSYTVRSTDGAVLRSFKQLDEAVRWASSKAAAW